MRKSARFQFLLINARVEEYWTRTNSHNPNCLMTLINIIKTKPKPKKKQPTTKQNRHAHMMTVVGLVSSSQQLFY